MCGIVGIVGTTPVNQALYDALTVLQDRPIDLVISDQRMPGIQGADFLKKVKEKDICY